MLLQGFTFAMMQTFGDFDMVKDIRREGGGVVVSANPCYSMQMWWSETFSLMVKVGVGGWH